jgi:hypothetical protein
MSVTLSVPPPPSMSPVMLEPVPSVSESSPSFRLIAVPVLLMISP